MGDFVVGECIISRVTYCIYGIWTVSKLFTVGSLEIDLKLHTAGSFSRAVWKSICPLIRSDFLYESDIAAFIHEIKVDVLDFLSCCLAEERSS